MRKYIFLIVACGVITLSSCGGETTSCGKTIDWTKGSYDYSYIEVSKKNVISYKGSPFSGTFVKYHENGQLLLIGCIKDGKLEGLAKQYYSDGQLYSETNYKDGKEEGFAKRYYSDGRQIE